MGLVVGAEVDIEEEAEEDSEVEGASVRRRRLVEIGGEGRGRRWVEEGTAGTGVREGGRTEEG